MKLSLLLFVLLSFAATLPGVTDASGEEDSSITNGVSVEHRAVYSKDFRIHVGTLGVTDGDALTEGDDFKPVWSKTGDKILFFRRVVNHPEVGKWKTAVFHMNPDGTEQHQITSGEFTDFNHTWTRDGTNTPIWNRQKPGGKGYTVHASRIGGSPGEEIPLTDPKHHAWAYTCLTDGRILVAANFTKQGRGYYLMTPNPEGKPSYAKITCELAKTGMLDRITLSPDETKICFEFTRGFQHRVPGRTLYLADFDRDVPSITNVTPFANQEGKPIWFAYPRFVKDASAIAYHAGGKLFLYDPADGATRQVSLDDQANYLYPHGEATPK